MQGREEDIGYPGPGNKHKNMNFSLDLQDGFPRSGFTGPLESRIPLPGKSVLSKGVY
jgi:hypothetical protein